MLHSNKYSNLFYFEVYLFIKWLHINILPCRYSVFTYKGMVKIQTTLLENIIIYNCIFTSHYFILSYSIFWRSLCPCAYSSQRQYPIVVDLENQERHPERAYCDLSIQWNWMRCAIILVDTFQSRQTDGSDRKTDRQIKSALRVILTCQVVSSRWCFKPKDTMHHDLILHC